VPASATVTCAIQVGGTGRYSDPDAASASGSDIAVAAVPPTPVTYAATVTDEAYLCTTWTITNNVGESVTYSVDRYGTGMQDPDATCPRQAR
jgi:hypothetical protein